jgi:hypothetical protein
VRSEENYEELGQQSYPGYVEGRRISCAAMIHLVFIPGILITFFNLDFFDIFEHIILCIIIGG